MLKTDPNINIDCVDPLGRTALLMGIDNENLEIVELLLENKVSGQTGPGPDPGPGLGTGPGKMRWV